jgi:Domain of unknown function (DUF4412)
MRSAQIILLTLAASWTARADFSYTMTQKSAQTGDQVVKYFLKGQKMKDDRGKRTTILDFGAQTITVLDHSAKTYTVTPFADVSGKLSGVDLNVDVKNTGQKKDINGFNASQVIVTVDVDMPQAKAAGMKPNMEMELWISHEVPGGQELASFFKKNAANLSVLAASGAAANPGIQKAMGKIQQAFAQMDGVPVMEIVRVKMGSGGPSAEQMQQMAQARAQLEAMSKQGGAQAAAAQAALARMGGAGGALFEVTMTGSDYSAAPIPDSAFAIPAGYTQSK